MLLILQCMNITLKSAKSLKEVVSKIISSNFTNFHRPLYQQSSTVVDLYCCSNKYSILKHTVYGVFYQMTCQINELPVLECSLLVLCCSPPWKYFTFWNCRRSKGSNFNVGKSQGILWFIEYTIDLFHLQRYVL